MLPPIQTINLSHYNVNCYLVNIGDGYVLIDTGSAKNRAELETALQNAGCLPNHLKLILLTHADIDHAGNCAYLQNKYRTPIALHHNEAAVVQQGSNHLNRAGDHILNRFILSFFRLRPEDCFKPDRLIDEGSDLSQFGFTAEVLFLPGHSCGSIGILTAEGDLFCGDLFTNLKAPQLNPLMDDKWRAQASLIKLKRLNLHTVYPGHGQLFAWNSFIQH